MGPSGHARAGNSPDCAPNSVAAGASRGSFKPPRQMDISRLLCRIFRLCEDLAPSAMGPMRFGVPSRRLHRTARFERSHTTGLALEVLYIASGGGPKRGTCLMRLEIPCSGFAS